MSLGNIFLSSIVLTFEHNEPVKQIVALSGKMAQNAFFGEMELLSFSCTLLSLEHTNSFIFQNGQFLTENQLFL